jgi:hypothetical protein
VYSLFQALLVFAMFAAAVGIVLLLYAFYVKIQCGLIRTQAEAEAQIIHAQHPPVPDHWTMHYKMAQAPVRHPLLQQAQPTIEVSSPMPLPTWWPQVVQHGSHLDVIGQNTSGKTTLAEAILTERAQTDKIVIIDTHGKFNPWCGLTPIGIGRNFKAVETAMQHIYQEFDRRFQPGEPVDEQLTVFIDEYPSLAMMVPSIVPLVKQMLRESPKSGLRLVLLSQEPNAKTFGFDGEAAIRKNLLHVLLGEYAAELDTIAAQQPYPAVLQQRGKPIAIDTAGVPRLAQRPVDTSVLWQLPPIDISRQTWTPEHVKVAEFLSREPNLSAREVSRRLWPHKDSGGRNAQAAARLIEEVRAVTCYEEAGNTVTPLYGNRNTAA